MAANLRGDSRMPRGSASKFLSLAIHVTVVILLFTMAGQQEFGPLTAPDGKEQRPITIYLPASVGGGGVQSLLPASYGRLPRPAPKQFTPPKATIDNQNPRLPMEPTLVMPPDVILPLIDVAQYGDPAGVTGTWSGGPGKRGGIGPGDQGGVGPNKGPSYGDPNGIRGHSIISGMIGPILLWKIEPEYSEEARKAKYQGTVVLYAEVDIAGKLQNIRVVQGLGLGLDEKAIEAVRRWKFRPASKDGRPVVAPATIEVNFRLL